MRDRELRLRMPLPSTTRHRTRGTTWRTVQQLTGIRARWRASVQGADAPRASPPRDDGRISSDYATLQKSPSCNEPHFSAHHYAIPVVFARVIAGLGAD